PGQCLAAHTEEQFSERVVRGRRFAGTTVLDPAGFPIALSVPGMAEATAVWAFGTYALAWHDGREATADVRRAAIRGVFFSPTLAPIAPFEGGVVPLPMFASFCPEQDQPAIAASASAYLIVYREGCTVQEVIDA